MVALLEAVGAAVGSAPACCTCTTASPSNRTVASFSGDMTAAVVGKNERSCNGGLYVCKC
jgi:hypothetical protein